MITLKTNWVERGIKVEHSPACRLCRRAPSSSMSIGDAFLPPTAATPDETNSTRHAAAITKPADAQVETLDNCIVVV